MRTRPLLVLALVVLTVGATHAWPPIASRPAPAPTLDQLIDRLAELKAQEVALQARRAELERQVRDRLDDQARRLQQVGVMPTGAVVPIHPSPLPTPHSVDLDPLTFLEGVMPAQVPANVGFPPVPSPEPVAPPVAPDVLTVGEPVSLFANRPGWVRPSELENRLDALGGMPLAYTRWVRDNDLRTRRAPEPLFHMGYTGLFGGN